MQLLAAMIGTIAQALSVFFAIQFAKKIAFAIAAVSIFGTMYGAMVTTMNALINPLLTALFSTTYGQFIGLAFPPIAGTCFGIIATAWAACSLYQWQKQALDIFIKTT